MRTSDAGAVTRPPGTAARVAPLHPAAKILHRAFLRTEKKIQEGCTRSKAIREMSNRYKWRGRRGYSFPRLNARFSQWRRQPSPSIFSWNYYHQPSRVTREMLSLLREIFKSEEVLSLRRAYGILKSKLGDSIPGYSTISKALSERERKALGQMFKARRQARARLAEVEAMAE